MCKIIHAYAERAKRNIQLFHMYRGQELKNTPSMKGKRYDNAVAEATFKLFKTELGLNDMYFDSPALFSLKLGDFVN